MWTSLSHMTSGRNSTGNPDVSTYDRVGADVDAAQDRGSCINGDTVTDDRVTRNAFDNLPVLGFWEGAGTQCDTLVNFHIVANDAGSAYDNTCAVIDKKSAPNFSARMDVDAGQAVANLGH